MPTSEQLTVEDTEREAALASYLMVRGILGHNELLKQGIQPVNAEGEPLYVTFATEEKVAKMVREAYGSGPRVVGALATAYADHYKHLLDLNKEDYING